MLYFLYLTMPTLTRGEPRNNMPRDKTHQCCKINILTPSHNFNILLYLFISQQSISIEAYIYGHDSTSQIQK